MEKENLTNEKIEETNSLEVNNNTKEQNVSFF
jgi:hypothetical protein